MSARLVYTDGVKKLETLQQLPPWEWPESATATLLGTLADTTADPTDRLLAAKLASESPGMDDRLAEALLTVLGDRASSETLRAQAALALGPILEQADVDGLDDAAISQATFSKLGDALRAVYEDPSEPQVLRRRALEAAVRAPQDWQTKAIQTASADADASWQLTAAFCMRFARGFDAQIIAALDSANAEIRCEAVLAAAAWQLEAAFDQVAALIRPPTSDKALLLAAIEAVASIRPEEASELLARLLESPDEDIALSADEAINMAAAGSFDPDEGEL
jgi:hypothetical protein